MKVIGTGETSYSQEDAEELRRDLIGLRDASLTAGEMNHAVILSHAIGFMARAIAEIWKEGSDG